MGKAVATKLAGKVEQLLRELGYTITHVPDGNAVWHYVTNHPPARSANQMHLVEPKGTGALMVAMAGAVSPQHLEGFQRLDDGDRVAFLFELKRALIQLPCEYRLIGADGAAPGPDECPRIFEVSGIRFVEDISKDELYITIGNVFKTWLLGVLVVQERLGGGDVGPAGRFDFRRIGLP